MANPKKETKKKAPKAPRAKSLTAAQKMEAAALKAAEEEAARKEEVFRRLEAERQAEEAKLAKRMELERVISDPEMRLTDMKKWLSTIPLSQQCLSKLERDFSDGVLVAEIIAHYCPDLVDTRHFFRCYSYANKYSNWDFLNRKVFPELGFELKKAVIYNLIRPFGCGKHDPLCSKTPAIYSLLTNIRVCLSDINETVFQYREESEESEDSEVSEDSITKIECNSKPMEKKGIIKKSVQPKISLNQRLSKIEMMIESGYYDRKEEQEGSERCMSFQPPQEQDWVSFYVPGGVISSEDCKPVNFCSRCYTAPPATVFNAMEW